MLLSAEALALELKTAYSETYPKYIKSGPTTGHASVGGICADFMAAISEYDSDIQFSAPYGFGSTTRNFRALESGDIDVYFCVTKSQKRLDKSYQYIDIPLYSLRFKLAVRAADEVVVDSFQDIAWSEGNVVLVNAGTNSARKLKQIEGLAVDDSMDTLQNNLQKLLLGRGRFIYFHDFALINTLNKLGIENEVKLLPKVFESKSQYIVFSPSTPLVIVDRITKVLLQLENTGRLGEIRANYGME